MGAEQVISIAGAAMVLGAFGALQFRKLGPNDVWYLLLNLAGSGCLALAAALGGLWAFVVLNTVWGLVSLRSLLVRRPAGPEAAPAESPAPAGRLGRRSIPG